jgi:quercetin dioxygenase-like cupin family protein
MSGARILALLAVAGLATACVEVDTRDNQSATSTPQSVTNNGVTGTVLGQGFAPGGIEAESDGETDVVFRKITINPGSDTGWHYHNGELIATITAGTLTREFADCTEQVSKAGDAILEPEGSNHVHIGRNKGTEPIEMYVTYIIPKGSKLAIDAPAPACATK